MAAVDPDDFAVREQHPRRRRAGSRQPDDQVRTVWERRAHHGVIDCWYSVKPIAAQIAATIQKRRMILVSDHPSSSKW